MSEREKHAERKKYTIQNDEPKENEEPGQYFALVYLYQSGDWGNSGWNNENSKLIQLSFIKADKCNMSVPIRICFKLSQNLLLLIFKFGLVNVRGPLEFCFWVVLSWKLSFNMYLKFWSTYIHNSILRGVWLSDIPKFWEWLLLIFFLIFCTVWYSG